MHHEVTVPLALGEDGGEEWRRVGSKCVVLRAVRDMYRPDCNELSKTQLVLGVSVPEPYREYTSIVGKHYLDVTLCRFVPLARFSYIVEVDYAAHERQIARPRLESAQISFFVFQSGLFWSV